MAVSSGSNKAKKVNYAAAFTLLWMTIAMPLYIDDHYFNALQAKGHAFDMGCIIACVLICIHVIKEEDFSALRPRRALTDSGILILAGAALVSCVICGDFKAAFWGDRAWCVGGFAFMMAAILYLYLSKTFSFRQNLWLPVIAVNGFIFIVGVMHSAGIDVFRLHENIYPSEFYQYISTIGNVNWFVGYLCMLMPMLACFFIESEKLVSQVIYLFILALGEINMVLTGSDGLILGIGICAFFGIPYVFGTRRSAVRVSILLLIYGLSSMLVLLNPVFAGKRELINGMSEVFLRPVGYWSMIVIGVAGIVVFSLIKEKMLKKISKALIIVLEIGLGAAVLIFIVNSIITFGPRWGTGRGDIWASGFDIFINLDPVRKMFGVGPEMLGGYFANYQIQNSKTVLAAHSEPLQVLLSTGLIGLVGWIMVWTGVVKRYFADKLWRGSSMAFFLPLAAYLGQSLVNTPMAMNFGIFIVMLSLFVYFTDLNKKR